jgi:hypothetical protein
VRSGAGARRARGWRRKLGLDHIEDETSTIGTRLFDAGIDAFGCIGLPRR